MGKRATNKHTLAAASRNFVSLPHSLPPQAPKSLGRVPQARAVRPWAQTHHVQYRHFTSATARMSGGTLRKGRQALNSHATATKARV